MLQSFLRAARAAGALLTFVAALAAPAVAADPWLFVSDIHLDPANRSPAPVSLGEDTNDALLRSALAEMRRVAPNAPVVVIGGDFLAHRFDFAHRAIPTMRNLARAFDTAFPHAQFVITLGNEDSACGDYALAPDAPFLAAVAQAWAPLVNRNGAAPGFARTFAHDGFYVARLPLRNAQLVALDDVFWSPRYRAGCGSGAGADARAAGELRAALASGKRSWVLLHIPPGIDAFSTAHFGHRLVVVPFLDAGRSAELESALTTPPADVALVVAGHIHRFAYRVVGAGTPRAVPLLVLPAISPLFEDAPAFLTADVAPDGTLRAAHEIAFDGTAWQEIGSTRTLGLRSFTEPELAALQRRLERDEPLRTTYDRLYTGGARPEIIWSNWRVYWCAADHLGATEFRACMGQKGYSIFTRRGLALIAAAVVAVVTLAAGVAWAVLRRRQRRV